MSRYTYNKNFFEKIDCEKKAYWLGFLYADGCINRYYRNEKLNAMSLEIGLSDKDRDHLQKFLSDIESNVPIKSKVVKLNGEKYNSSKVVVCNTKMCRDLIKLGCTPQKSLTLTFPNENILPKQYIRDFIRGYFDGDGCIFFGEYDSLKSLKIIIVGTFNMVKAIEYHFKENQININPMIKQKGKAYQMVISGFDNINEIHTYFYENSTVYLNRKHEKFTESLNYINQNRKSTSGKTGVYFDKRSNRWVASFCFDGKRKQLGSFINKEDAIKARKEAESL
ncbi:hypothetical protein [Halalkalibacter oceani]|uniref:hypothetical protein n=1 Tax=Halalkalibacter oceani TaxID=1653776 RepID=UPI0033922053